MKFYLGVTDNNWFDFLSLAKPEDINFWQPTPKTFNILPSGGAFLFKLKAPRNAIGGVGFFTRQTILPLSIAWEIFGERNGAATLQSLQRSISGYRKDWYDPNPTIGCIVLTDPIFFRPEDWIKIDWNKNIVQGKSYELESTEGRNLWAQILPTIQKYLSEKEEVLSKDSLASTAYSLPQYGFSYMKVRLGQGPFRILVTDAYSRKCAISGERTLPVLEAAHIKSYSSSGPHALNNGILLRSDLHKLFDTGYITITNNYKIEISKRIKEEYENGKEYYQFHGKDLVVLPNNVVERPASQFIEWHNGIFKG